MRTGDERSIVGRMSHAATLTYWSSQLGFSAELELGGGRRLRVTGLDNLRQLAELVAAVEEQLGC